MFNDIIRRAARKKLEAAEKKPRAKRPTKGKAPPRAKSPARRSRKQPTLKSQKRKAQTV
jgi:hypothetical protein